MTRTPRVGQGCSVRITVHAPGNDLEQLFIHGKGAVERVEDLLALGRDRRRRIVAVQHDRAREQQLGRGAARGCGGRGQRADHVGGLLGDRGRGSEIEQHIIGTTHVERHGC